jgi:23S rRNA A2030 N6-methylase RlmJ
MRPYLKFLERHNHQIIEYERKHADPNILKQKLPTHEQGPIVGYDPEMLKDFQFQGDHIPEDADPAVKAYPFEDPDQYKEPWEHVQPIVRKRFRPGELALFPGAPMLAQYFMSDHDSLVLNEDNDEEFQQLKQLVGTDPRVQVTNHKTLLSSVERNWPPLTRNGVSFFDFPHLALDQSKEAFELAFYGLRRWPSATHVLTYPLSFIENYAEQPAQLYRALTESGFTSVLGVEMHLDQSASSVGLREDEARLLNATEGIQGVGMAIVNPPQRFDHEMRATVGDLTMLLSDDLHSPLTHFDAFWATKRPERVEWHKDKQHREFKPVSDDMLRSHKPVKVTINEWARDASMQFLRTLLKYRTHGVPVDNHDPVLDMNDPESWPVRDRYTRSPLVNLRPKTRYGMPQVEYERWQKAKQDWEKAVAEAEANGTEPPAGPPPAADEHAYSTPPSVLQEALRLDAMRDTDSKQRSQEMHDRYAGNSADNPRRIIDQLVNDSSASGAGTNALGVAQARSYMADLVHQISQTARPSLRSTPTGTSMNASRSKPDIEDKPAGVDIDSLASKLSNMDSAALHDAARSAADPAMSTALRQFDARLSDLDSRLTDASKGGIIFLESQDATSDNWLRRVESIYSNSATRMKYLKLLHTPSANLQEKDRQLQREAKRVLGQVTTLRVAVRDAYNALNTLRSTSTGAGDERSAITVKYIEALQRISEIAEKTDIPHPEIPRIERLLAEAVRDLSHPGQQ